MQTIDCELRKEFASSIESNFSVICPAGSGKTQAICDRVTGIAASPQGSRFLPNLAVVTFTKKAAEEIQERARDQLLALNPSPSIIYGFNRAFFGTIHSFAASLLKTYGHYIGVPSVFKVLSDDEGVWNDFQGQSDGRPMGINCDVYDTLIRLVPYDELLSVVRTYDLSKTPAPPPESVPQVSLDELCAFPLPKRADQSANITAHQTALKEWRIRFQAGQMAPFPKITTGGTQFVQLVNNAFSELRAWAGLVGVAVVNALALEYRRFRIKSARLTYDDLVTLAASLFENPAAAQSVRARDFRIILDEAQDTDPTQFELLLECTREADSPAGRFLDSLTNPPRAGHFSMVGDPQQSIYGERTDVRFYRRVQEALLSANATKLVSFAVTFRCDQSIVAFANQTMPSVLNGLNNQVLYTEMAARPNADSGQVLRLPIETIRTSGETDDIAFQVARKLAGWIKETGLAGLRARTWREVALLCPRKEWFFPLRRALVEVCLQCNFQSTKEIYGASPAFAWFTAVLTVWSQPENSFEIFGVLREIFGQSDHDIAIHTNRQPTRLHLKSYSHPNTAIESALDILYRTSCTFRTSSIRAAINLGLEEIKFAARLAALPTNEYPDLLDELDELLMLASEADAQGLDLSSFVAQLSETFNGSVERKGPREDTLTIITNLKSKGLQWDCVVLPFFGRDISFRSQHYPRVVCRHTRPIIAYSSCDLPSPLKDASKLDRLQEIERLLYVSITRARRTLVFADDTQIWAEAGGQLAAFTFATALRVDADNQKHWANASQFANPAFESNIAAQGEPIETFDLPPRVIKPPRSVESFPRRIVPHLLIAPCESALSLPGESHSSKHKAVTHAVRLDYGVWWHQLMHAIIWDKGQTVAREKFNSLVNTCPDPERAAGEWNGFLRSSLSSSLFASGVIVRTEFPFMVPLADGNVLEGVLDLLYHDTVNHQWGVVDWKTDRGTSMKALMERHSAQLAAYRDAMSAILGQQVSVKLYSSEMAEHLNAQLLRSSLQSSPV